MTQPGTVYIVGAGPGIVGAGPGSLDYLTLRGYDLLQRADCLV
jgi:uroporphyrinogen III methyltransferase/synthase